MEYKIIYLFMSGAQKYTSMQEYKNGHIVLFY